MTPTPTHTPKEELEGRTANGDPVPGIDLSAAGILGAEAGSNLFSAPPSAADTHAGAGVGAGGAGGAGEGVGVGGGAGAGAGPSLSSHEMEDRLLAATLQRLQAPPAPLAAAASDGSDDGDGGEVSYSCRYSDFSYCDLESSQTLMDRVVMERAATRAAKAGAEEGEGEGEAVSLLVVGEE